MGPEFWSESAVVDQEDNLSCEKIVVKCFDVDESNRISSPIIKVLTFWVPSRNLDNGWRLPAARNPARNPAIPSRNHVKSSPTAD